MSTELTKLDGLVKERFAKEIKGSNKVQRLVDYLSSLTGTRTDLEVDTALDVNVDGQHSLMVQLRNEDDSVRIHFQEKPKKLFGRVIVQANNKKVAKIFEERDSNFELVREYLHNEKFIASLKELENYTDPDQSDVSTQDFPCIHGHWCGAPFCSGPEAPATPVDACCKEHDLCYGDSGYFDCECDSQLQYCLLPYVQAGSEYAIIVFEWFNIQPCS